MYRINEINTYYKLKVVYLRKCNLKSISPTSHVLLPVEFEIKVPLSNTEIKY